MITITPRPNNPGARRGREVMDDDDDELDMMEFETDLEMPCLPSTTSADSHEEIEIVGLPGPSSSPDEVEASSTLSPSTPSPFKEVIVTVPAEEEGVAVAVASGSEGHAKKRPHPNKAKGEQPWMVGNVYSWPVGRLFDHIEGTEEWEDQGCSSDEDDLDSEGEDQGQGQSDGEKVQVRTKKIKKRVDDILLEMGMGRMVRARRIAPTMMVPSSFVRSPQPPPRFRERAAAISDAETAAAVETIQIQLRLQDILTQAVEKYVD